MSNDKIINLETYEVIDDNSKFIIVDSLIADTIAILNKLKLIIDISNYLLLLLLFIVLIIIFVL